MANEWQLLGGRTGDGRGPAPPSNGLDAAAALTTASKWLKGWDHNFSPIPLREWLVSECAGTHPN